jgi:hypothetical protein
MDGAAWRGGACIARGHAALDASGQAAAGGYAPCGARTSPFARRCARGHPRPSCQLPRTWGRVHGHPVGSGANAVRAGCPIARPRDRARTGNKGGAPHISANREKTPHIRRQKLTVRHPRSAHASGADRFARRRSLNRFNKMSVARMIALAFASTRTRPSRPFSRRLSRPFRRGFRQVSRRPVTPSTRQPARPASRTTLLSAGSSPSQ